MTMTTKPISKSAAIAAIKKIEGMTARLRDGEIRVNHKGGDEATAYYTDDAEDALETARAMAAPVATKSRKWSDRTPFGSDRIWYAAETQGEDFTEEDAKRWDTIEMTAPATPAKTLILKQDIAGQWMYQITRDGATMVPWQYGPFDRAECVAQAKARFGGDCQEANYSLNIARTAITGRGVQS